MKIEELIAEMQAVRQAHSELSIMEVLKLFEIHAIQERTRRMLA